MWGCGGRKRRRLGGLLLLLLLLGGLLLRRYYPCLPVVSEACENAVLQRFNWSSLVPLQLWGRTLGLQAEDSKFSLEGMPFRIFGGSMHYFRVPKEYWRDRMVKMKTCGLNTLTTYVPWNLHEAARGKFDFSGNLDLEAFLTLAAEVGLWVILRPGPYICSEWDLGGLPREVASLQSWVKGFQHTCSFCHKRCYINGAFSSHLALWERSTAQEALSTLHDGAVAEPNDLNMAVFLPELSDVWLLQDPEMQLRTTYRGFTEAVDAYFDHLMARVVPLQYKKGGPIIAVQVENEYGSYAKDPHYLTYIKMALLDRGIVELLMTSDNKDGLSSGYVEGALATINFQKMESSLLVYLDTIQQNKPKMVMEYWTGWFDSWGGPHNIFDADDMVNSVADVLKTGASINLYMFHGGTNFGFMNGALDFDEYKPDVTSYDYDAVLTEAGDYTSKFFKLRQLFTKIIGQPLPLPPMITGKASYGAVLLQQYVSLWEVLPSIVEPVKSEFPVNMENLPVNDGNGQAYGYTLYETVISGGGQLHSRDHVRDRAQVFVNTVFIGYLDYTTLELSIPEGQGFRQLRLLVENCGRVNYGLMLNEQRKGLIGDIFLNKIPLRNFKIYSLEMKPSFMESLRGVTAWSTIPDYAVGPAFFRGNLQVQYLPQDTFLKLEGWEKGVVFINGGNLGRYWKIGPQETLYLPATWLQPGNNEIIVFEERSAGRIIQSVDLPYLGRTHYMD